MALTLAACVALAPVGTQVAWANENAAASEALAELQTQTYYTPGLGVQGCPTGTNVGWLREGASSCSNECYAFVAGVCEILYGCYPTGVGTHAYWFTNPGQFNCVGTVSDADAAAPTLAALKSLLLQAYPGDVIQACGGNAASGGSFADPQHTALVAAVSTSGITIYQHLNGTHVSLNTYSWEYFYSKYLGLDQSTSYAKGISLYHYANYDERFPVHVHDYSLRANVSYSTAGVGLLDHMVTYTGTCACGASAGEVQSVESCQFYWTGTQVKCAQCGKVLNTEELTCAQSLSFAGHTYLRFDVASSYWCARAVAYALGGRLVSIGSASENEAVKALVQGGEMANYWIGLSTADGGVPCWLDGSSPVFSAWGEGQLNVASAGECAATIAANGQWTALPLDGGDERAATGFVVEISDVSEVRLAGDDAVETAAAIARAAFPDGCETVVLARDDDFADALSASGYAGALNAAILLTNRLELSSATRDAILELGASKVIIVGGPGAVVDAVEEALCFMPGVEVVTRVYGQSYYETSLACAKAIAIERRNFGEQPYAIVAIGTNFQDALSISSFAYRYGVPILLETPGAGRSLTEQQKAFLQSGLYRNATILVPSGVVAVPEAGVEGVFGPDRVVRICGEDGYETSRAVAEWLCERELLKADTAVFACGASLTHGTDALAGAVLAGKLGCPLVLVNANAAMEPVATQAALTFAEEYGARMSSVYELGGTFVMPTSFTDALISRIESK